jgi:hypothetical protein
VVKELYNENCKILKKEVKQDNRWWNNLTYSWTDIINFMKIAILLKEIYRFNAILIKILMTFFTEIEIHNYKIYTKAKKIPNSQSNSEQKVTEPFYLFIFRVFWFIYSFIHMCIRCLGHLFPLLPIPPSHPIPPHF